MHNADEVLDDLGITVNVMVRASHWLNPINPAAYRAVTPALLKRLSANPSTAGKAATTMTAVTAATAGETATADRGLNRIPVLSDHVGEA
jgi:hypothetical protein